MLCRDVWIRRVEGIVSTSEVEDLFVRTVEGDEMGERRTGTTWNCRGSAQDCE